MRTHKSRRGRHFAKGNISKHRRVVEIRKTNYVYMTCVCGACLPEPEMGGEEGLVYIRRVYVGLMGIPRAHSDKGIRRAERQD